MSGNLFKDKCTSILLKDAHRVVDEVITKIREKFPQKIVMPVGSAGFKEESSDLDIAVEAISIDELKSVVTTVFGHTPYMMEALYIVSIPYKYMSNGQEKFVSIDFIQMIDAQYTHFRYKSPNYLEGESKYKVGTKIMLVGDLLRISPLRLKGLDANEEAWMDYAPIGLYRYVHLKPFIISSYYYKQFVTIDKNEVMRMIFKVPKEEWFNSVESIWDALHTQEVVDKEMVKQIEASFFVNCYRKSWEAQVQPEDFRLDYWTVNQIRDLMKKESTIRKANQYLDKVINDA